MRCLLLILLYGVVEGKRSAKDLVGQLYEDLLYDYNKIPRPVKNSSDILTVEVGASLIRIIDVDEKNQVLTTNLWLEMKWYDAKLTWSPEKYGGTKFLHIPSDLLWTPDLVLYNNAAGDPDITILTDALVTYQGQVFWQPPAIFKSFCSIDVTWFPYDEQKCEMKFGTWTYTGRYVDLKQLPRVVKSNDSENDVEMMEQGMDLSFFYRYVDITYYFQLRRKTLFFTCNLIIPCFLISILTTFVFYLTDHKITFSISILVTLTVFFLVLIDIMPPTSLVIPMFGRYLITTMILVALSTVVSVVTVNFRFRSGSAHQMSPWIRSVFLNFLPKVLMMHRPELKTSPFPNTTHQLVDATQLIGTAPLRDGEKASRASASTSRGLPAREKNVAQSVFNNAFDKSPYLNAKGNHGTLTQRANKRASKNRVDDIIFMNLLQQVRFIAEHFQHNEREAEISDDWTFVAMVLDRLFLIIFSILNVGTFFIILRAPSLYDTLEPLNITVPSKPLGQASLHSSF